MPGGVCKRQRQLTKVAPRSAPLRTSIWRFSTSSGLSGGRPNPVELLRKALSLDTAHDPTSNLSQRLVFLFPAVRRDLFPEVYVVGHHGEHQAVMVLMVGRRIAEHLHACRREKLVDIRFPGNAAIPVTKHGLVAVENGYRVIARESVHDAPEPRAVRFLGGCTRSARRQGNDHG